jgi:hypothetical protein
MKKVWKKPKLVGLYRGRPEEAVLSCCKNAIDAIQDSMDSHSNCKVEAAFPCDCCDEIDCT